VRRRAISDARSYFLSCSRIALGLIARSARCDISESDARFPDARN
jgi:hypothetical protein